MSRLRAGSATDVGLVRAVNQDRLLVSEKLFAVADGMGGHAAGEVAARAAVDSLRTAVEGSSPPTAEWLAESVRMANESVWQDAQADPKLHGMGTTLTALAWIDHEGGDGVAVANVGDSRTYRMRDGQLEQLTVDHNLVAELVAEGHITEVEAETHPQRHAVTRALGVYPEVDVDVIKVEAINGDRFMLCSDGLSGEVPDSQIASVLRRFADPAEAARELVAAAREHGGSDNITVVVVDVATEESGAPGPEHEGCTSPPTGGLDPCAEADQAKEGKEQPPAATGAAVPASRRRWWKRRRAPQAAKLPRNRLVTLRVVGFMILLLAVAGAGVAGTVWYARSSYFVGLRGGHLTIFQGRPGGVLWIQPRVVQTTTLTAVSVEPYHLSALRSGVVESDLAQARSYVRRLRVEAVDAGIGVSPSPARTSTTAAGPS